jgi:hypothetical protein
LIYNGNGHMGTNKIISDMFSQQYRKRYPHFHSFEEGAPVHGIPAFIFIMQEVGD